MAMRLMPSWKTLKALAHTLPHDAAIIEPYCVEDPLPVLAHVLLRGTVDLEQIR